jgi:hypothetical protein
MRSYYAIVKTDEYGNQICEGLIDTYKEINFNNYIPVVEYDKSYIGKMKDGDVWIEDPNKKDEENILQFKSETLEGEVDSNSNAGNQN